MGNLYELLCYHSLQYPDPLLVELLSYLPTLFHLHFFDQIVHEKSDDENNHSDSIISAFYSDDSTYFSSLIWRRPSSAFSTKRQQK